MSSSIPLKVWILICHAFIIIGIGHGVLVLGIAEIFSLWDVFRPVVDRGEHHDIFESTLRIVALCCLAGQILMIWSIRQKDKKSAGRMHIISILVLWASILIFAYAIRKDDYAYMAGITCVPFLVLSLWSLIGQRIRKWIRNKEWPEVD
jgi:hypothetical protein